MQPRQRLAQPRRGALLALSALAITTLAGCSLPYRAMPLEDTPAHARPFHQQREGFVLSADLLSRPSETAAHLFFELQERDLYPVVLHVENSGSRTAILRREAMVLRLEGVETALKPLDPDAVIDEVRTSPVMAYVGLPLIVPYLVGRQEIAEFNFAMESDYRTKSFPRYLRVAPGDADSARVIFFRIPSDIVDKLERSPVLEVQAEIESIQSDAGTVRGKNVQFLLSLG
ncbi:MAG: hypothetical protein AAF581_12170 [Planctomycetota bacterium]